jgi:hypothetical protein
VDTLGLLVVVLVTAASVQDRDGGRLGLDNGPHGDAVDRARVG